MCTTNELSQLSVTKMIKETLRVSGYLSSNWGGKN